MDNTIIIEDLPGIDALGYLRDRNLATEKFRQYSEIVCELLLSEATKDIESEEVVVIPILRAGLAMLTPVIRILPSARVGFVGLERDEETAIAREYYWKLPSLDDSVVLILDPMLATGGSVHHALKRLDSDKIKEIRLVSVISAPEGIEKVHSDFPDVKIITASVDEGLDAKKFIVPGLGDYGDRYFGTS